MRNTTVLISGAGIAGSALAYWLGGHGFEVTVVERAPAPRPGGQAVDFKGAAQLGVLRRMGILDEVHRRQTGKTDITVVDGQDAPRALISGDWLGGDVEILRGDLAAILHERTADRCDYRFGDSVAEIAEVGPQLEVRFERAAPRRFDLVFGADGIHSRVRRRVFGPERDFVRHRGYYYAVAGEPARGVERGAARMYCEPGRSVTLDGAKAGQMYVFAAPELDYARGDLDAQRAIVRRAFAGAGWRVPEMLAELDTLDGFYLDAICQAAMDSYVRGRVALLGDAACGNTLGGFGTGLALLAAYVLAGELVAADGEHAAAFARYDRLLHGYAKRTGASNPGPFLAPPSRLRLRLRDWTLNSSLIWGVTLKLTDWMANDIALPDYPVLDGPVRERAA